MNATMSSFSAPAVQAPPTARQLSATLDPTEYNLIVITARPYFTHLPKCIRATVTPEGNFHK